MRNIFGIICLISIHTFAQQTKTLAIQGQKPDLILDDFQVVKATYGFETKLFFTQSSNQGATFESPIAIATIPQGIALAMGRGPRIATLKDATVISVVDKKGNVFTLSKSSKDKNWSKPIQVNEISGVADEGFCAITSDNKLNFYLLWSDNRSGQNELYGSISRDNGQNWGKSQLIYTSTDTSKSICPCCKPSLVNSSNGKVYVMWRNLINENRDMYILPFDKSEKPKKLGTGSWKINACPMDGGGISSNQEGNLTAIWRRERSIYTSEVGKEEVLIDEGRNPTIDASADEIHMAWQKAGKIWYKKISSPTATEIGTGDFPKIIVLKNNKAIVAWEGNAGDIKVNIVK